MKDITLLIAHPDDEALFLWPFLDRVKRIVCVSDDMGNPARPQYGSKRFNCLSDVGELLGCKVFSLGHPSEFYRLETRPQPILKRLAQEVIIEIAGSGIIATHNAWGEYGNIDHILCHHIARTVQAETGCELLVTDIATEINWLPVRAWPQADSPERDVFEIDRPLFDRIKAIYDARGCWTWAWEPVERCRVYSL